MNRRTSLLALVCLLPVAFGEACGSDATVGQPPAPILIVLSLTGATIFRGANAKSSVSVTRTGVLTGAVDITVSGAPVGVTALIDNVQTAGSSTTAVLTVTVGPSAALGTYTLTVRASSTAGPASTNFVVTVAAPPG
ncbi:MAG TPA: hypothetical protein VK636_02175 [Gemmatimonadaceae bacterium]|nr:hypothetical protein [Gemmatimonadaceae bacterium]